jgi:threonine/homoserine/homoserine lactone efflux protein
MLSYLFIGITYGFAAAVQPGPFQSYLISQSLSKGWRKTLPASFAPLISDGPIIVLVVFLLNQVSIKLIIVLQCLGGLFLLYLAMNALKAWKNYGSHKVLQNQKSQHSVIHAAFVNFLNPAPYLSWSLVMGPLLLKGWQETPVNGITLLVGFYSIMIIVSMGIIILFASVEKFGDRVNRILIGLSAIALGCFGIYQLWSGISYFRLTIH